MLVHHDWLNLVKNCFIRIYKVLAAGTGRTLLWCRSGRPENGMGGRFPEFDGGVSKRRRCGSRRFLF
jgi:hypothetical protein